MTSYHIILLILLAILALLLHWRGEQRAIDPNYGILTAAAGLPRLHRDRRRRDRILLDLDNFHAYNLEHGHTEVDQRVRSVFNFRRSDGCMVVKRGGDEIVISCPAGAGDRIALVIRERLADVNLTATMAIAHNITCTARFLPAAEAAIIGAKNNGNRNTIIVLPTALIEV